MPAAPERELRTQGRKTQARLLEAGLQVLGERGYQATRVDDVVRVADTSHGTFYLYFENKDALFRALAHTAADEMAALADELGPVGPDAAGRQELRNFLGRFADTYERHGAVIRAWAENQVDDPALVTLGLDTFGGIAAVLGDHMAGDRPDQGLAVTILLGTIERLVYYLSSRPIGFDTEAMLDELAGMLHRGFFGGAADAGVTPPRAGRSQPRRTSRRSR
jgi:AcrR family transcriptional regulator